MNKLIYLCACSFILLSIKSDAQFLTETFTSPTGWFQFPLQGQTATNTNPFIGAGVFNFNGVRCQDLTHTNCGEVSSIENGMLVKDYANQLMASGGFFPQTWRADFTFVPTKVGTNNSCFNKGGGGPGHEIFCLTDNSNNPHKCEDQQQDAIMIHYAADKPGPSPNKTDWKLFIIYRDGTGISPNGSPLVSCASVSFPYPILNDGSESTPYYFSVWRTQNSVIMQVFVDPARTQPITGTRICCSVPSTVTNLHFLQLGAPYCGNTSRSLSGSLDDLNFYNYNGLAQFQNVPATNWLGSSMPTGANATNIQTLNMGSCLLNQIAVDWVPYLGDRYCVHILQNNPSSLSILKFAGFVGSDNMRFIVNPTDLCGLTYEWQFLDNCSNTWQTIKEKSTGQPIISQGLVYHEPSLNINKQNNREGSVIRCVIRQGTNIFISNSAVIIRNPIIDYPAFGTDYSKYRLLMPYHNNEDCSSPSLTLNPGSRYVAYHYAVPTQPCGSYIHLSGTPSTCSINSTSSLIYPSTNVAVAIPNPVNWASFGIYPTNWQDVYPFYSASIKYDIGVNDVRHFKAGFERLTGGTAFTNRMLNPNTVSNPNRTESNSKFLVAPNPSSKETYIRFKQNGSNENATVVITNMEGKVVKEFESTTEALANYRLELQDYNSGVYIIKIKTHEGVSTQKFIIE